MLTFLGKKSLALAVPMLASLAAAFDLAGLQGEIFALGQLIVTFTPPSISGLLGFNAALGLAIPNFQPPSFDLKADLILRLELLKLKLKLLLEITNLLLAAGIHVYRYEGAANKLGPELTSELATSSQGGIAGQGSIYTILLVVESSASVTVNAMKKTFGDT